MIEGIVVINKAGLPAFHCKSPEAHWNEEILSAFLSALESFIEYAWKNEQIFYIELGAKKIIISRDILSSINYVLVASLNVPIEIADGCLVEFRLEFEKLIPAFLGFDGLAVSGSTTSFLPSAQKIMEQWSKKSLRKAHEAKKICYGSLYAHEGIRHSEVVPSIR
ncbi:MAG: hypothetical protein ACXAB4_00245 [Candidatus Hodarchaeales archaeon]